MGKCLSKVDKYTPLQKKLAFLRQVRVNEVIFCLSLSMIGHSLTCFNCQFNVSTCVCRKTASTLLAFELLFPPPVIVILCPLRTTCALSEVDDDDDDNPIRRRFSSIKL